MTVNQPDGDGQSSSLALLIWLMMTMMVMVMMMVMMMPVLLPRPGSCITTISPLPLLDGNTETRGCAREKKGKGSQERVERDNGRAAVLGR